MSDTSNSQETGEQTTPPSPGGIAPRPQSTSLADKDAEHVDETSRFADGDEGDNSVLLDDEGYVGVETEYRNAAYDKNAPMRSEDEDAAKIEADAKEGEILTALAGEQVGFRGYATNTPHPSERKNLADEALRNRARIDEEARQEVRNGGTDDDES